MEERRYLIVGLGNPRKDYENTRHNMGERIAKSFAEKHGWVFKKEKSLKGDIAKGNIEEKTVIVFLPSTYMNESGIAVKRAYDYFRIAIEDMLVLVDDADILFGEFRLKDKEEAP